jgi:hypothetical protein
LSIKLADQPDGINNVIVTAVGECKQFAAQVLQIVGIGLDVQQAIGLPIPGFRPTLILLSSPAMAGGSATRLASPGLGYRSALDQSINGSLPAPQRQASVSSQWA